MGQKQSKQQYPWPPYGYPNPPYGTQQPFIPPGFQPPPQHYPGFIPPQMYGQGATLPPPQLAWLPQQKQQHEMKKRASKRTQSEQFPGGFVPNAPFPQPVIPPTPTRSERRSEAPVIPKMPRSKSRSNGPSFRVPERQNTPFMPHSARDAPQSSETTSSDEDEEEFSRRRSRRSKRHRARSEEYHPITGNIEDVIQPPSPAPQSAFGPTGARPQGPLRNPLPPPPRDLYEMTPYKSLLSLPQTTALLSTTNYGSRNANVPTAVIPAPAPDVAAIIQPASSVVVPNIGPAPPAKKKKGGLFRKFSKKRQSEPPAQAQARAQVQLAGGNSVKFIPVYMEKPGGQAQAQRQGQSRASTSNAPASEDPPAHPEPITAGLSAGGFTTAGLSTGFPSGGLSTGDPYQISNSNPNPNHNSMANPDLSNEPIRFTQTDSKFSAFMNHSPHRVVYNGLPYPTATHLHEALKYLPANPSPHGSAHSSLAERIRQCPNVLEVYPLSAELSAYQRPDWGDVFLQKMEEVLDLKFSQHANLRTLLLDTWPSPLVYADQLDGYWGVGGDGSGANELGRVLMRVRERMKREATLPR